MFQFLRRNAKQLRHLHLQATQALGKRCRQDKRVHRFLADMKSTLAKIQIVLHQQGLVRRGILHIPRRIVSFHKDHARPIVRGKFPLPTEFGPKVLFGLVKKRLHVLGVFNDNVSDATLILPALRWFKTTFGRLPKEIFADRGFFSRTWVRWLTKLGIQPGLQPRGKRVDDSTPAYRRMVRRRLPIEAFISPDKHGGRNGGAVRGEHRVEIMRKPKAKLKLKTKRGAVKRFKVTATG